MAVTSASRNPYITIPVPIGGVRVDVPYWKADPTMLSESKNMVLRDNMLCLRPGLVISQNLNESLATDPDTLLATAAYTRAAGTFEQVVWYTVGGAGRLTYHTGGWNDAVTPAAGSGAIVGPISWRVYPKSDGANMENWLVWCNGAAGVAISAWDSESSAATYAVVANAPAANAIMILAGRLLAFGFPRVGDDGPCAFRVSDQNDFAAGWATPQQEGQIIDTPGDIVAALEAGLLRGHVYKTDSIYIFSAGSSTDAPFTIELGPVGIEGPINRVALCADTQGIHYWVSQTLDLWMFDGVNAKIVTPAFKALARSLRGSSRDAGSYATIDATTVSMALDRANNELVVVLGYYVGASTNPGIGIRVALDGFSLWPMEWPEHLISITSFPPGPVSQDTTIGAIATSGDAIASHYVYAEWFYTGVTSRTDTSSDLGALDTDQYEGYANRQYDETRIDAGGGAYDDDQLAISGVFRFSSLKANDDKAQAFVVTLVQVDQLALGGGPANTQGVTIYGDPSDKTATAWSTGARVTTEGFAELRFTIASNPGTADAPLWPATNQCAFFAGGRVYVAPRYRV
jgi:hypothetical protein